MPSRRTLVPKATAATPAAASDAAAPRDLVAGLEKGLAVIEAFDQENPRLTIAEVAERTGLTRAAARRYLLTLAHLGFASHDRKVFALTPKVLRLAQSYMVSARLPRIVQPELHRLAQTLKEASSAGVLEGSDVLCIAATRAGRSVSETLQPGTRVPAYCTSNGRVLLAALPGDELDAWLELRDFAPRTARTLTGRARLRDTLLAVRAQGYACVDQELEVGLRTLAVPLMNHRGAVVAAMNVSVNTARASMEQLIESALPPLLQAQAHLRQLL